MTIDDDRATARRATDALYAGACFYCGKTVGLDDVLELGVVRGGALLHARDMEGEDVPIAILSHMDCDGPVMYWLQIRRLTQEEVSGEHGLVRHVLGKRWASHVYASALEASARLHDHLRAAEAIDASSHEEPDPSRFVLPFPASLSSQSVRGPGVYAVQSGGFVKIGRAVNVADRVRGLQTAHPKPLRLLALLSRDPEDEKSWHREFERDRCEGEWFRLTERLAEAVRAARKRVYL